MGLRNPMSMGKKRTLEWLPKADIVESVIKVPGHAMKPTKCEQISRIS